MLWVSWVLRYWLVWVLLLVMVWIGFYETPQWSFGNRLLLAFSRVMACVLLLEVLVISVPSMVSFVGGVHAPAVLRLVVVMPSRAPAYSSSSRVMSAGASQAVVPRPVTHGSSSSPVSGGTSVLGGPSLSAAFIDRVLSRYGSPAVGTGQALYALSQQYGIDDAFALAFFWHESNFGLNGEARVTHSLGNLRCIANVACIDQDRGGYAAFPDWATGYAAWYALIAGPMYVGDGLTTVQEIIPRYAPAADHNDEQAYIDNVVAVVGELRSGQVSLG
jgi:hypothetical protein